jgi:5-methylcytosine-specific restriction endonuclease McrA
MTAAGMWVRLDPYVFSDDKMHSITGNALKLWLGSLCYCNQALGDVSTERDGIVTPRMLDHIKVDIGIYDLSAEIAELIERMLWVEEGTCYLIVNYSKYQKTRDQIEREKRESARRVALHRSGITEMVKDRDQDRCRYCGERVSFADRRDHGATYDYVDPRGMNIFDNVVVCCRACKKKKASRTLKAAHMELLPPPPTSPNGDQNGSSTYLDTPKNELRNGLDPRFDPKFNGVRLVNRVVASKIRDGRRIG